VEATIKTLMFVAACYAISLVSAAVREEAVDAMLRRSLRIFGWTMLAIGAIVAVIMTVHSVI